MCVSYMYMHIGKFLTALLAGLSDRSSSVRKAHAKAIGYLIKVCIFDETLRYTVHE